MIKYLREASSVEYGLIAAGGTLIVLVLVALLYRMLAILVGSDLALVILGLAVFIGLGAWFVDSAGARLKRRAEERAEADRERAIQRAADAQR